MAARWTGRAKLKTRHAAGDVEARLALERQRLQADRAVVAADQRIGADAGAEGRFRGGAAIVADQRPLTERGRGIDRPHQPTARGRADVDTELADRAFVNLAPARAARHEHAADPLLRRDNHAHAARD